MIYSRILLLASTLLLASCSESDSKLPQKNTTPNTKTSAPIPVVDRQGEKGEASAITPINKPEPSSKESSNPLDTSLIFKISDQDLILGKRDAKIVVFEYSSPTCPHCSYFHRKVFPEIKSKYIDTGKIAYVIREFIANKQDFDAAILGRCYKDAESPTKLLDVIYIQQENWAFNKNYKEILSNIGQLAGISREMYNGCLGDAVTTKFLVDNSRTIASMPGFIGTPAFYINGIPHKGNYDFDGISKGIEEIMAKNKNKLDGKENKDATNTKKDN